MGLKSYPQDPPFFKKVIHTFGFCDNSASVAAMVLGDRKESSWN